MGRHASRRLRPRLESLEVREVLSTSVPAAVAPIEIPIATYNGTFTKIEAAFRAFEGPYDDTLNAIGNFASSLVSAVISPSSANDPNSDSSDDSSTIAGSKGDGAALQGRLQTAISKLPNGLTEANALINQTFYYGGLTPGNAEYFKSNLTAMLKRYISVGIKRGEFVLVWPGQHHSTSRS
jgi:hypothetical protein